MTSLTPRSVRLSRSWYGWEDEAGNDTKFLEALQAVILQQQTSVASRTVLKFMIEDANKMPHYTQVPLAASSLSVSLEEGARIVEQDSLSFRQGFYERKMAILADILRKWAKRVSDGA